MKIKIEIRHWMTGAVLFEFEKENNTIRDTVLEAIKSSANLSYADLRYANLSSADLSSADLRSANLSSANLSYADLRSANLSYADLRYANLSSADLRYANLSSADLSYADLRSANLSSANLSYADLRSANLSYADLRSANLSSADLRYADLRYANLSYADLRSADLSSAENLPKSYINQCSRDILFIFEHLKAEVPFLREKLIKGEIDGTQYEGDCACLIGTLANADGGLENVCSAIPFYDKGLHNFGEQWFLQIHKGDTPENNQFAKHVLDLIDNYILVEKK